MWGITGKVIRTSQRKRFLVITHIPDTWDQI